MEKADIIPIFRGEQFSLNKKIGEVEKDFKFIQDLVSELIDRAENAKAILDQEMSKPEWARKQDLLSQSLEDLKNINETLNRIERVSESFSGFKKQAQSRLKELSEIAELKDKE
jgi:hypothetical protein